MTGMRYWTSNTAAVEFDTCHSKIIHNDIGQCVLLHGRTHCPMSLKTAFSLNRQEAYFSQFQGTNNQNALSYFVIHRAFKFYQNIITQY